MSSGQGMDDVEIIHTEHLIDDLKRQLQSDDFADLVLIVDSARIPVHKIILASRSNYFRALLYGGLRESNQREITLHDTDLPSFKVLLEYIYTGLVNLSRLKVDVLGGVLALANKYGFPELEDDMIFHMKKVLNERNVCALHQVAFGLDMADLSSTCLKFIDRAAKNILRSPEILNLTAPALKQILLRDSICAQEIDIFSVVRQWAAINDDPAGVESLLGAVRWDLLTQAELVETVRESKLLQSDMILDIFASQLRVKHGLQQNHRGFLDPGVNVATGQFGASVVSGEMGGTLLDGDATNYDHDRGYARHQIESDKIACVHVKLGMPCIINHVKMLLWDKDQRSYSYCVELSYDGAHWTRVADYSQFYCRSWQEIYFPACTVQHIKVVGTHNTANKTFHLVKLEAMWMANSPDVRNGVVDPKENVVSLAKNANVTEGVSRSRHALINGSLLYDWDSGYCCHQIGSGSIVVQLAQPYYLSSLRFLLWDMDDRLYTYVIHTSTNQQDWQVVADTRSCPRRSWQSHRFPPRAVSFIRLQGLSNTANEVFHVVHLEAPDRSPVVEGQSERDASAMLNEVIGNEVDMHVEEPPVLPLPILHRPSSAVVVPPAPGGHRVVHLDSDEEHGHSRRNRQRKGPR